MEAYFYPYIGSDTTTTNVHAFEWGDASTNKIAAFYNAGSDVWETRYTKGGTIQGQNSIAAKWRRAWPVHVLMTWDYNTMQIKLAVNGSTFDTDALTGTPLVLSSTVVDILESFINAGELLPGRVKRFAYGTGPVSEADKNTVYAFGDADRGINDYPPTMQAQLMVPFTDTNARILTSP
jgi:hypothetical protein